MTAHDETTTLEERLSHAARVSWMLLRPLELGVAVTVLPTEDNLDWLKQLIAFLDTDQ